ncbi:MAG: glycosyltransferase family 2 protein, partial [Acidimicrobiales bacterium]|nr:glycosyltransferase family 2 protein [Acidimicrobiales bacterium]
VVPAYNESVLLPACLRSLAQQDFTGAFEVIVVDNGSTDLTAEVARQHGAIVVVEPVRGVCSARQTGTESATGEIIVSTDADTTFSTDWLRRIDDVFNADPATVLVAGPVAFVDAPLWARAYPRLLFGVNAAAARHCNGPFYISACNVAFKKSAWSGYNTQLTQAGDELDLLRRIRVEGRAEFDNTNPTFTSSRRLQRGLLYSLFITFFTYYLLDYAISRFTDRTFFGSCPTIRTRADIDRGRNVRRVITVALLVGIGLRALPLVGEGAAQGHSSIRPRRPSVRSRTSS